MNKFNLVETDESVLDDDGLEDGNFAVVNARHVLELIMMGGYIPVLVISDSEDVCGPDHFGDYKHENSRYFVGDPLIENVQEAYYDFIRHGGVGEFLDYMSELRR